MALKHQVFARLSVHAKLQARLDELSTPYQRDLERIEEQEILAFDDDAKFTQLEQLKKELLSIDFLQEEEKSL